MQIRALAVDACLRSWRHRALGALVISPMTNANFLECQFSSAKIIASDSAAAYKLSSGRPRQLSCWRWPCGIAAFSERNQ
jgi:hypothetical protein